MKRSSLPRAFSLKGTTENYWLSLFLFSILVVASFLLFEQQIQQLLNHLGSFLPTDPTQRLGLALLLVALLTLDVLLPVPSSLVALLAVAALGAIGGYLVIFIGLCLGACLGYWLGAGYFRLLSNWLGLRSWQPGQLTYRLSTLSLVCLRGVPVLAETSVLAAGMQRYPLRQFLLVTTLANAGLALAYSAIGSLLVEQNALLATILASMVLPGLFLGGRSLLKSRVAQPQSDRARSLEGRFEVSYHYPVLFSTTSSRRTMPACTSNSPGSIRGGPQCWCLSMSNCCCAPRNCHSRSAITSAPTPPTCICRPRRSRCRRGN